LELEIKSFARTLEKRGFAGISPPCERVQISISIHVTTSFCTCRHAYESPLRNNRLDPKDQEFLMGHILPGTQDPYYDSTKAEQLRKKYMKIEFFPQQVASAEELRKKQVLDTVKLLGFSEDKIKRVEEALAKYETVDHAMEEIKKLSLESYKLKRNPGGDPQKMVSEEQLENYLAQGWNVQTVLPSGRIVIKKNA